MTTRLPCVLLLCLGLPTVAAQSPFLFTTSQTEQTLSGSGGTALKTLRPNEVAMIDFGGCMGLSAEKWAPRTCYGTMAGDENGDTATWNPTLFGTIDALHWMLAPIGPTNQRTVFFSPSAAMQPGVSGAPAIRPGDTARIVRDSSGFDGQVEYFLTMEQVVTALGMPVGSIVDVDAIAGDIHYGIFFSLDTDAVVSCGCNEVFVRDGDVLWIAPPAIQWAANFCVQTVWANSVHVIYTEAQMDAFLGNAVVSDATWACLGSIQDLEGLDIDYNSPPQIVMLCSNTVAVTVPALAFTGETMTGCSVVTTGGGGSILQRGCATLGSSCWFGATTGTQIGLLPPSSGGVPSFINALATAFPRQFTVEPQQHQVATNSPVLIDVYSPGIITAVFAHFDSMAANSVAPSLGYANLHFPDEYITGYAASFWVNNGYSNLSLGSIPFPCKIVWQAVCITAGSTVELSTPATLDVY